MVTPKLYPIRPTMFWYAEGLLSLYATVLSTLATYAFWVLDYPAAFMLVSDTALLFVSMLILFAYNRRAWEASLIIVVVQPIIAGAVLPLVSSAALAVTLLSALILSPLIVLTLTDWDLEAFFSKEFAFPPVVQLRAILKRR